MTISKGPNKFCIYSLIQFFQMFVNVRDSPNCVCDFMFRTTNKHTMRCLWFYQSYFTQNIKLVNLLYNFFFLIGIFTFLCTNYLSKLSVPFIGDLNFGSRKYLSCSLWRIWLNFKSCFCRFLIVIEFWTSDS